MQFHQFFEDLRNSRLANALAEVHQLARFTGIAPAKVRFSAEMLHVGVFPPPLAHRLVAEVIQLLQDQQPRQPTDRQARTPPLRIQGLKCPFQPSPINHLREAIQLVALIQPFLQFHVSKQTPLTALTFSVRFHPFCCLF